MTIFRFGIESTLGGLQTGNKHYFVQKNTYSYELMDFMGNPLCF